MGILNVEVYQGLFWIYSEIPLESGVAIQRFTKKQESRILILGALGQKKENIKGSSV